MSIEIPNIIYKSDDKIIINNYTIIERIGVGSYGRIYKVKKHNQIYVLKEIPINNNVDNDKIESVKNEADILSSLTNKYIVKYFENFKMGQNIYIVMEYCERGDLCTYMSKRKKNKKQNYFFSEDFIWKLFIQISIGLYHIHSKKILHRDIKTLNIFLTKELNGKIGDLGVAKTLEGTDHAMTFIGTPYYVSPEMCQNKPYNEKSDIWALGCILYELITFCHPFTASNQAALFLKILYGNYVPLPERTSKDLVNMVKFILQKNYIKRPTMKEIITHKTFVYHAKRLGLEKEINEVINSKKTIIINSTKYSINKVIFNLKKDKNQKETQNLKTENNNSSKLFIKKDIIKRNEILKRDIRTDRKIEKNLKEKFNSIKLTPRKSSRMETREMKNKININLNNVYSNSSGSKIINLESYSNLKKKNPFKLCSNSPTNNKIKRKNISNELDSNLITTSEFLKVLENTKKNRPMRITLYDLYNYQFNPEENKDKVLETTSATTPLLKQDNVTLSDKNLIYNSENKNKNNNEKNIPEANDLCDEFTVKEKKEKKDVNLGKNIHKLNYIDKIHKDKKEFENIEGMKNYELMKNSEICKKEYEKSLEEIKKYSGIINLEKLRKSYTNINNLTDEELNSKLESIVIKIKKKLPKNKAEKIAEDLYNLIYYENKFKLIERIINNNK